MREVVIGGVVGVVCLVAAAQFASLASEVGESAARLEVRSLEIRGRLASVRYGADGKMVAVGNYDRDAFHRDMNTLASHTEIIAFERDLAIERYVIAGAFGGAGSIALGLAVYLWRRRQRGRRTPVRTAVLGAHG